MSVSTPLLDTIEPDEPTVQSPTGRINSAKKSSNARQPVVLTPGTQSRSQTAATPSDAESGIAGIFRQSAHPMSLFFLYFFRIAAITIYVISGFLTDNYVLSTVMVVVLLAMDFWNCRNVSGRTLVGLRFWNQVDDDGESYWVFESRDPSRPANPIDSKMFWIALYVFPALWTTLLIVSILKLGLAFIPIVLLALVFNITNVIGFTYADRDAKQRWANDVVGGSWSLGLGGIGGQLLTGAVQKGVGRVFGS
ncbi:Golgi apparatus membrane protein TVP23 [Gymnopus androsaceus JB14]|uniref:Golgi apparatus membrane protein TVP23 n=1 Tax=Gymnopus androsaceus JB14 TaxID=1447944 RepID=A0A6A4IN75_9AGAR|nr:Golgi apparatus membrane protein TVP23 [Gymnopus androsaceus JB14]